MNQFTDSLIPVSKNPTGEMLPKNRTDPDISGFQTGSDADPGNNGARGSVSYANNDQLNWTLNLTTEEFLEMMLGPKQVILWGSLRSE